MRYIPARFAPWKRVAEEWFHKDNNMLCHLFQRARAHRVCVGIALRDRRGLLMLQLKEQEDSRVSLFAMLMSDADHSGVGQEENAWIAGAV